MLVMQPSIKKSEVTFLKLEEKQEQMKLAAIEFASGKPIESVMQKYGVCYASVYNALKRFKIPYAYPGNRKIQFNKRFFQNIDTEDKAYWLGFIFADGSITKTDVSMERHNRLSITLSVKDVQHLYAFCDSIDGSHDMVTVSSPYVNAWGSISQACHINCNSVEMAEDLISHNCIPRKTYLPAFPDDIPDELMHHFIRGYFDGDGCISGKQDRPFFEITSEKTAVESMQLYLMRDCAFRKTKLRFCRNAYTLRYGGRNQVCKIYHYLYDDAHVFLKRKYDKFRSYFFKQDQTISSPGIAGALHFENRSCA